LHKPGLTVSPYLLRASVGQLTPVTKSFTTSSSSKAVSFLSGCLPFQELISMSDCFPQLGNEKLRFSEPLWGVGGLSSVSAI